VTRNFRKSGTEVHRGTRQGQVVNDRNQSQYSNIRILYKNNILIYELAVIALVRENGSAIGARLGINKVQVET